MEKIGNKNKTLFFLNMIMLLLFIISCILLHTSPDRLTAAAFCHQIPSRSSEYDFPFCYRCSGLFGGICFGWAAAVFCRKSNKLFSPLEILTFFVSASLFLIDILNSSKFSGFSIYPETVKFRLLSAYPLGFMIIQIIWRVFSRWLNDSVSQKRIAGSFKVLLMPAGGILTYIFIFSHNYVLSLIFRNMLAISAVALLTILYTLLILCIIELKNHKSRVLSALSVGFIFAMLHIILFGGIHIRFIHFDQFFS